MAEAMRILVTGFEPFGGAVANPALEAVRRLPAEVAGARVLAHALPVAFGRDAEELRGLVRGLRPDAVVCVGQAGGRSRITPEFVGINYALARIPDNDGARPRGVPVVPGGPDAYFATVPLDTMVRGLELALEAIVGHPEGDIEPVVGGTER